MNGTAVSVASTLFAQTMTAVSTSTVAPTLTTAPTKTSLPPIVTRIPLPFKVLDGLRVAYVINGNLYVQDSGEEAIQLTNSGQNHNPVFSDDGEMIVFSRESKSEINRLNIINTDGTGDHVLVANELLISLGLGYDTFTEPHSVAFVPGTHLLLFNTHNFSANYPKTTTEHYQLSYDLMLVDTNSGMLNQLAVIGDGGFFLVSQNGKWVAIQAPDHVDVIDLQGRFVLRNLAEHPLNFDCVFYEGLCTPMYWTEDSKELILVQHIPLSESPYNGARPTSRTIWRYSIDGIQAEETRFMPPPMDEALSVSPDGKWIVYSLYETGSQDGIHLGNLQDGSSREINEMYFPPLEYNWSPNSVHFISDNTQETIVGNIQGNIIERSNGILLGFGWIDNERYFYNGVLSNLDGSDVFRVVDLLPGKSCLEPVTFVYVNR